MTSSRVVLAQDLSQPIIRRLIKDAGVKLEVVWVRSQARGERR